MRKISHKVSSIKLRVNFYMSTLNNKTQQLYNFLRLHSKETTFNYLPSKLTNTGIISTSIVLVNLITIKPQMSTNNLRLFHVYGIFSEGRNVRMKSAFSQSIKVVSCKLFCLKSK